MTIHHNSKYVKSKSLLEMENEFCSTQKWWFPLLVITDLENLSTLVRYILERNWESSRIFTVMKSQNWIRRISSPGLKVCLCWKEWGCIWFSVVKSSEHSVLMVLNSTGMHENKSLYLYDYHSFSSLVSLHFSSI